MEKGRAFLFDREIELRYGASVEEMLSSASHTMIGESTWENLYAFPFGTCVMLRYVTLSFVYARVKGICEWC